MVPSAMKTTTSSSVSRIPTKIRDSFIDAPVSLNIPSILMQTASLSTVEETKQQQLSPRRVNNRHSSRDWIHNIASIPRSTVLREIMNPVLAMTVWSTFISLLHRYLASMDSPFWKHVASNMCIPTQMHSFMVSSLGLLLVFRTNSAYQRFVVSTGSAYILFLLIQVYILGTCSHSSCNNNFRKEEEFGNRYCPLHEIYLACYLFTRMRLARKKSQESRAP